MTQPRILCIQRVLSSGLVNVDHEYVGRCEELITAVAVGEVVPRWRHMAGIRTASSASRVERRHVAGIRTASSAGRVSCFLGKRFTMARG